MIYLHKQKVLDEYYKLEPKKDLLKIQKAIFIHRDIFCTLDECGNIWQNYSWSIAASWLFISDDLKTIVDEIESSDRFVSFEQWSTIN